MSLTTRPKPKTYHKKRQAGHHRRQSKVYMKPYFPYLPMLGIVGSGVVVNEIWAVSAPAVLASQSSNSVPTTTLLSVVTGDQSSVLYYSVLAITFLAFTVFVITHWYRVHRLLNRGEAYMVKHPWFDATIVFIATAGVVLTRS